MIKRVKATAIVLSAAMAFAGITGCGGEASVPAQAPAPAEENMDMDDPNEGLGDLIEEEADEESSDEAGERTFDEADEAAATEGSKEYAAIYLEKINELEADGSADRFALVDIDSDEIPELIASDSEGSFDHDNAFIFTFHDGKAELLASVIAGVDGGNLDFSRGGNLIHVSGAAAGMRDVFYEIEDGKLKEVFSAEASSMNEDAKYSVNGEDVKEEEYYEQINAFVEAYNPMTRIAYDGLYEINYTYADGYGSFEQGSSGKYSTLDEISKELE